MARLARAQGVLDEGHWEVGGPGLTMWEEVTPDHWWPPEVPFAEVSHSGPITGTPKSGPGSGTAGEGLAGQPPPTPGPLLLQG